MLASPAAMAGSQVLAPASRYCSSYRVMALPPLSVGAAHATPSWVFPAVSVGMAGAEGTAAGVTVSDADHEPLPCALTARACTSYSVPFVRPAMVCCVLVPMPDLISVHAPLPVRYCSSYRVMALPPVSVGALHEALSWVFPGLIVRAVGALGVVTGVAVSIAELPLRYSG